MVVDIIYNSIDMSRNKFIISHFNLYVNCCIKKKIT